MKKFLLFLMFALFCIPWAANAQTLTVCDGTNTNSYVPFYGLYADTQGAASECVIPGDSLVQMVGGTISAMTFYLTTPASVAWTGTHQVYIGEVEATTLTGITGPSSFTVVKTASFDATGTELTITFDDPYTYGGGNLLIGTYVSVAGNYKSASFTGVNQEVFTGWYRSSASGAGTGVKFLPKTTFTYTPGSGPVCATPETMVASNVTATSATLTWTGGSGTYNVEYKGGSVQDWTAYLTNTTATTANLSGLTPGTAYQYRVQSVCGDATSGWKSVNFSTMFGIPFVENFNTTSLPTGWTRDTALLANVLSGTSTIGAYNGGWTFGTNNNVFDSHARLNIYGTSCNYWLVLPTLAMEDNVQLTFDMALTVWSSSSSASPTAGSQADDKFAVLINDGNSWTVLRQWDNAGSEYVYDNITNSATGQPVAIDLSSYAGQNIAIAFYGESTVSGGDNNLHIDNVSINYIPNCAIPTGVGKSNVTAHTAVISWTSEASAWTVAYKAASDEDFTAVEVNENPYTLSGLTPETSYTVKVRANCGSTDGFSDWSGTVSFTTPVACVAPTSLSNTNVTYQSVKLNWTSDANNWDVMYIATADSDTSYVYNVTEKPYVLEGLSSEKAYKVHVRANCGDDDGLSKWSTSTTSFTTPSSCAAPTGLACTALTETTATLSWNEAGTSTEWKLQYWVVGMDTTEVTVDANPYTLTGLTAETVYGARVCGICNGAPTAWSSTVTFEPTAKLVIGSGTTTSSYLPTTTGYDYSFTQQIYTVEELGDAALIESIDFYMTNTTAYTRNLDIYMVSTDKESFTGTTDWIAVTDADKVFSGEVNFAATSWTTIPLNSFFVYDGLHNVAIIVDDNTGEWSSRSFRAFTASATQSHYAYQDNTNIDPSSPTANTNNTTTSKNQIRLMMSEIPDCLPPTGVVTSNVTGHKATISWTSDADAWQVMLNNDEENIIDVTENTYTFTELTPETTYPVKVRTHCTTGNSDWVAVSFTTTIACPAPTGLTASLTEGNGTVASLNWTETGSATQWQLQYSTEADFSTFEDATLDEVVGYSLTGLTPEATYYARVKAICGGADGDSEWSNVISFTPTNAVSFTVDRGTTTNSYVPVYGLYVDDKSYSQFIIPADSLVTMQWGNVTKMTFHASSASVPWTNAKFEVYMTETEETTLSALADWTTMDKVMNEAHLEISGNQMVVTLDAPYQYMGGNLMIGVKQTVSGTYQSASFYGVSATGASMGGYGTSVSQRNFLPKTTFTYIPGEEPTCFKPSNLTATQVGTTSATLNWEGTSDSYVLQYRTAAQDMNMNAWQQVGSDVVATSVLTQYTFDLADYEGTGTVAIRHYNISGMYYLNIDDIVITNASGEEVVNEDFEAGSLPADWTTIDLDGDSYNWIMRNTTGSDDNGNAYLNGAYCATSASYDYEDLTPDNWLIIPNVELGGTMTLWARGQDPAWAGENFGVFVTTGSYGAVPAGEWVIVENATSPSTIQGLTANTPYEWQVKGVCNEEETGWVTSTFNTIPEGLKTFVTDGNWDVDNNWFPVGVPTIEDEAVIEADAIIPAGVLAVAKRASINGGSITIKDGGQLKQGAATLKVKYEKEITGYGENAGGYNLIASPFSGTTLLSTSTSWNFVTNLTSGNYDFYAFNSSQDNAWRNYEASTFEMAYGNGYLYANEANKTLTFTGTVVPSIENTITRNYTYDETSTGLFNGWILVGNPFSCNAYINYVDAEGTLLDADLYVLNETGDGFELATSNMLAPATGAFLKVAASGTIQYSSEPIDASNTLSVVDVPCLPLEGHGQTIDQSAECPCGPIVLNAEHPTEEITFDNMTSVTEPYTGFSPRCWTWTSLLPELYPDTVATVADTLPHLFYKSQFAHSGDYSLRLWHRGVYAMPELQTEDITKVKMSFWCRQSYPFYTLQVGVMTDPTQPSTFVPVAFVDNGSSTDVKYFEFDFSDYEGEGTYIAFKNVISYYGTDIYSVNYIDNIKLELMPEVTCETVTLPHTWDFDDVTEITNAQTNAEPACWELVKSDVGEMAYDMKPQVYYGKSYDGDYSLLLSGRGIYAMPEVDAPLNTVQLSMYVRQPYAFYQMEVGVWEEDGTFVPMALVNNGGTVFTEFVCNFSNYSGNGGRIAFRNTLDMSNGINLDHSYNYIDHLVVTTIPTIACDPITMGATEDFENYTETTNAFTGVEPDCWELVKKDVNMSAGYYPQLYYNPSFAHSGNYSLLLTDRCVYAMPELPDGVNVSDLHMKLYVRQPYNIYQLEVGVWDESEETFTSVKLINNSTSDVTLCEFDFPSTVTGGRIAFRNTLNNGATISHSYNYIDDIELTLAGSEGSKSEMVEEGSFDTDRYLDNIVVYPNPTTGVLHIDAVDVEKVECYSQMGQLVGVYDNVNELNISELAEGVYMLRITVPQGVTMRKVVKR